jgi:hypothetical protein
VAIYKVCTFSIQDGTARCRKEAGKCDSHRNGNASWKPAPRPTTLLLKVNVNDKWERKFVSAGIPVETRSFERAEQLEQERVCTAEALGRNAYAIRADSQRGYNLPEDADTGCPVFGKDGLANLNVSLQGLGEELGNGFTLTRATLLKRFHKPPTRLVLEFSVTGTKAAVDRFPFDLFRELIATTFNQVDVWANEKKADERVVHTINCGKRDDSAKPQHRLSFANGDWDVIPIVPAAE